MLEILKVVYITMQFPATTETFASNDVLMLDKLGVSVSVFSMKPQHKKYSQMIDERNLHHINLFNCNFINILFGFFLMFRHLIKTLGLIKWIITSEKNNGKEMLKCLFLIPSSFFIYKKITKICPDVVHLFWGHYPSIVGYLVSQYKPSILLSTFLGAYDLNLKLNISKFIALESDLLFTHSYSNIPSLLELGISEKNIETIHRSIDIEYIDNIISGIDFIKGRIVTAGKLVPEKNFDITIQVLKKLVDRGGDFSLDIIGSGPELLKLKLLTKKLLLTKRVKFYEHMSQYNLFKRMALGQFFFFPSNKNSERLPNVLKEAMYCKCVCVSSKTQGIHELIESKVNGYTFDKIDVNLENFFLLSSQKQLNKIALNARQKISLGFQIKSSMLLYKNKWEEKINDLY